MGFFKRLLDKRKQAPQVQETLNQKEENRQKQESVPVDDRKTTSVDTESQQIERQPPDKTGLEPHKSKKNWLRRLRTGLSQSTSKISSGIGQIFTHRRLDDEALDELEDLLITADLGVATAQSIRESFRHSTRFNKDVTSEEIKMELTRRIAECLSEVTRPLIINPAHRPHVILMIGVNGSGKTTTIGKLAQTYIKQGRKVMLAAGDTFRAAAIEQLQVWGERIGATVVAGQKRADSAGLVFDAVARAQKEDVDVLLIDTAGRLQNKQDLMAELEKIVRVIKKKHPDYPHDTILVLDGTVGQNAISQLRTFSKVTDVSGLIVTKLDGSAKGGVVVGLADQFGIPIHAIGVGETAEDLRDFEAHSFARMLVGLESAEMPESEMPESENAPLH